MACCDRTARRYLEAWAAVWEAHERGLFEALADARRLPSRPLCPRPRLVHHPGPQGGRPHYEVDTGEFERWVFGRLSEAS